MLLTKAAKEPIFLELCNSRSKAAAKVLLFFELTKLFRTFFQKKSIFCSFCASECTFFTE